MSAGLRVLEVRPDPHPSPYRDTITKISPPPGSSVDKGSDTILWVSEGMGSQYVDVPNLIGMTVNQAERTLFELKLRSIAVDATAATDSVRRQSHAAGTRVREGFEIRIFTFDRGSSGSE
jgi:beta-lactam-binding protein with PASTA domain